jgi:hypothetical protein
MPNSEHFLPQGFPCDRVDELFSEFCLNLLGSFFRDVESLLRCFNVVGNRLLFFFTKAKVELTDYSIRRSRFHPIRRPDFRRNLV